MWDSVGGKGRKETYNKLVSYLFLAHFYLLRLRDWGASLHNLSLLAPAILTSIALSFNTLVIT